MYQYTNSRGGKEELILKVPWLLCFIKKHSKIANYSVKNKNETKFKIIFCCLQPHDLTFSY